MIAGGIELILLLLLPAALPAECGAEEGPTKGGGASAGEKRRAQAKESNAGPPTRCDSEDAQAAIQSRLQKKKQREEKTYPPVP